MKIRNGISGKLSGGYTLVELLVVLFIVTTVSSMVAYMVWVSLRSGTKAHNESLIRQEGNYAIAQVSRMLQYTFEFAGVSNDGVNYSLACQMPDAGALGTFKYVRYADNLGNLTVLRCGSGTLMSNGVSLINTSTFTTNDECAFTCTLSEAQYSVGVSFTLRKRVQQGLLDDPSAVPFGTSVTLRNTN